MKYVLLCLFFLPTVIKAESSSCFGTTSNGYIQNSVKLPSKGKNFLSYSSLANLAGRTYVHSKVRDIIITVYKELEIEQPTKVYKYAETGFKKGGWFKPHKTHQNGLSVDFMTPVVNNQGDSVHLPTNLLNKLGYNIEFDKNNSFDGMLIDFEALAAHIVSLHRESKKQGYGLWRVIFAPELQPYLFKTKYANYLKDNIQFSKKRSWVRHDEHYHVDFAIPCNKNEK